MRSGAANLVARTGRPLIQMLGDWRHASHVDETGISVASPLSHPSWHTRGIFAGMFQDFPASFGAQLPWSARVVFDNEQLHRIAELRGGTSSMIQIMGGDGIVRLTGYGDVPLPPEIVVTIMRH